MPENGRGAMEADLIVGGVHDVHPGVDQVLSLLLILNALHPAVEVALVVVHIRQVPVGSRQFLIGGPGRSADCQTQST